MLVRLKNGLEAVVTFAAALCLLILMSVVVVDVIARALNPAWRLYGTLDMVEFSLDWTISLSIAAALFAGQIISVDLIDSIDRHGRFKLLGLIVLLGILLVMGWHTIAPALNVLEWGEQTFDLGLPKFWYWIAIWVGLALSCVAVMFQIAQSVKKN